MLRHILIVEDLQEKYENVSKVIKAKYDLEITWSQSISAAYNLVTSSTNVDLILLDMAFAARTGLNAANANGLAGLELLQHIRARLITVPVIVVTSHDNFTNGKKLQFSSVEELDEYLNRKFSSNYFGTIRTQHNTDTWHSSLFDLMENVFGE